MARHTLSRLSAREVTKLSTQPGRHADGGGLYLQVSPAGSAAWMYRYMRNGRSHDVGLGSLRAVSLKEAREKTQTFRRMRGLEEPLDPLEERRLKRQAARLATAKTMTFEQCARAYIAAHKAGWKSAVHAAQWPSTLDTSVVPVFGALPVQAVDVGLVMKAVEPIWTTKPETAGRVRGRIEAVLDWASARGYRQGDNPARWKGHLANLLPKKSKVRAVEHHAALAYAELPGFMAELRKQEGVSARALEFAILTTARTGEVVGATWAEFDLANRLWTVPASHMKAGRDHRVPLGDRAVAILEEMAAVRSGEFVFAGASGVKPLSNMAMAMLLRRMGRDAITVHGFRSAFSDWVAEQTSTPSEVREMALAHAVGDKVEAAYRRGDLFEKRRQLADAWERFCASPEGKDDNVVPLRSAQ
jgi:integrase